MYKNKKIVLSIIILFFLIFVIFGILIGKNIIKEKNIFSSNHDDEEYKTYIKEKLEYLDSISVISKYNSPIIPKGFKAIDTEKASWEKDADGNAKDWNNGLVIEDEIGNQFVWIPVKNIQDFRISFDTNHKSQLEYLKKITEADYINQTIESKEMYESVKKYGGFYIARYEASIENVENINVCDGSIKPLSVKNKNVWNNIPWGYAFDYALDGIQGSDLYEGAVLVSRSMYPNVEHLKDYYLPENLTNETGVVSTLCYGVQWDAILNFMSDVENPYANDKFISNSIGMGWFVDESKNKLQLSGTDLGKNSDNCIKNIYDIAGNVYEWTMEAYDKHYRICRGGHYGMQRGLAIAAIRTHNIPEYKIPEIGFRVALYIK